MNSGAESVEMPTDFSDIPSQELKQSHIRQQPDMAIDTPRLYLLVAAQLARVGRHGDAERILACLDGYPGLQVDCLDLRARMLAQQGRFIEAETCWLQSLRLLPDNPGFQRGLAAVAARCMYPLWLRIVVTGAVAAVTAIVVFAVLFSILRWTGRFGL